MLLAHVVYVLRHKGYVFWECCRLGIPLRGILHDLSKFSSEEVRAYSLLNAGRMTMAEFKASPGWAHHTRCNDHHHEHWVVDCVDGRILRLEMSDGARREMVADWVGAGKAKRGPGAVEFYRENAMRMLLGAETRRWVEATLKERYG